MIHQLLEFFVLIIFLATPTYGLMKRETNRLKYLNMYRQKNTNIRLLRYTCGKSYNKIKLLRSDDIELNPGPEDIYKLLTQIFTKQNGKLKFFNINCQSLNNKKESFKDIIQDLGENTIYGITETWLSEEDDEKLWEINNRFKFFRYDRKSNEKKKGGGVILAVPKSLNPKKRPNFNHMSKNIFESLWMECKLTNSVSEKSRHLYNISYNPQKKALQ